MISTPRPPKELQAAERFDVKPTAQTHFAWLRTRMSIEQTAMSWVRTSLALIGFGFTIYQVLRSMNETAPFRGDAPRNLGLALIALGVIALILALWSYRGALRYLWSSEFRSVAGFDESSRRTFVPVVIVVLIFIGLWAFGAVWLRAT